MNGNVGRVGLSLLTRIVPTMQSVIWRKNDFKFLLGMLVLMTFITFEVYIGGNALRYYSRT
jgi:hypothetical protein